MRRDHKVTIIKRTSFKTNCLYNTLRSKDDVMATADEVYDFSRADHREDIMTKIIMDMYDSSDHDDRVFEQLMDEMKAVIEGWKNLLPFL